MSSGLRQRGGDTSSTAVPCPPPTGRPAGHAAGAGPGTAANPPAARHVLAAHVEVDTGMGAPSRRGGQAARRSP